MNKDSFSPLCESLLAEPNGRSFFLFFFLTLLITVVEELQKETKLPSQKDLLVFCGAMVATEPVECLVLQSTDHSKWQW